MSTKTIRIATRKSPLALRQANFIKGSLLAEYSNLKVDLVPLTTKGDEIIEVPLAKVGGKGLFVKELERALLENEADIAVHSMKDVPMEFPIGLGLAVICEREDPSDAFVSNTYSSFLDLPSGARVGTSSFRRQCQLANIRPDLELNSLRGNVGTRLEKLDSGLFDAIILASAGLIRLDMRDRITQRIPFDMCLPAGGQGAVGIECRTEDIEILRLINFLHHQDTATRILAERAVNQKLQGGCEVPIASFAEIEDEGLFLRALVGTVDGKQLIHSKIKGKSRDAERLGVFVAEDLLAMGAGEILATLQTDTEKS